MLIASLLLTAPTFLAAQAASRSPAALAQVQSAVAVLGGADALARIPSALIAGDFTATDARTTAQGSFRQVVPGVISVPYSLAGGCSLAGH